VKSLSLLPIVLLASLAGCGGISSDDEISTGNEPQIALRGENTNTIQLPMGQPHAVTWNSGQRVYLTTATPVAWSIKYAGGVTQGFGNTVETQGVTIVEETTNAPSSAWSASISGRTPSLTTLAFEVIAETQPRTVISFYIAQ
jgi:hypothetical protein